MPKDILLFISPSEFNHPKGIAYSRGQAFVNFVVDNFPDDFCRIVVDEVIPLDLMFQGPDKNSLHIEIKVAAYDTTGGDMIGSLTNGHLAQQLLQVPDGDACAIVVWGDAHDVYNSIDRKLFAAQDIKMTWGRYKQFKIDMWARHNIPVIEIPEMWGRQTHEQIQHPAKEMLKMGVTYFHGGSLLAYMNKSDGLQVGAGLLARVPTVGAETAEGLIKIYGSPGRVALEARQNPRGLAEVKLNGRKLGKKAEAIAAAFWGRAAA
jgi:ERCC4-type nuclease